MKKILVNPALCAAFIIPVLLSACSSADLYGIRQDNAQDTCRKSPEPERAACLTRNAGDYGSYKKQREALLDSSGK
ncbi:hypothetical protein [Undibacterium sp.]|uniref:hypothetical protein n=1 Tax=Undibacterium sp. TaxID=1914977 RepID=UPI00374D702D